MNIHVKTTAWLHIVLGALTTLLLLGMCAYFYFIASTIYNMNPEFYDAQFDGFYSFFTATYLGIISIFLVFTVADFIAGILLLKGNKVGLILTNIMNALYLIIFPIGTVIGAYGLWATLVYKEKYPVIV